MHGDWKELLKACEEGHFSTVRYYIEQGVDINFQHPEFFTTPLIEATRKGYVDIVELLLQSGAKKSIKSNFDDLTALDVAKLNKDKKLIAILDKSN